MISLATAWVLVTEIKHNKERSVSPSLLVLTGVLDCFIALCIAFAIG